MHVLSYWEPIQSCDGALDAITATGTEGTTDTAIGTAPASNLVNP